MESKKYKREWRELTFFNSTPEHGVAMIFWACHDDVTWCAWLDSGRLGSDILPHGVCPNFTPDAVCFASMPARIDRLFHTCLD